MVKLTTVTMAGTSSKAACTQLQQGEVAFMEMGSLTAYELQCSAVHSSVPVLTGGRSHFFPKEKWIPNRHEYADQTLIIKLLALSD